jgi:hypothetical protein
MTYFCLWQTQVFLACSFLNNVQVTEKEICMEKYKPIPYQSVHLSERLLDYAVAIALSSIGGYKVGEFSGAPDSLAVKLPNGSIRFIVGGQTIDWLKHGIWRPSEDHAQGGPLIDQFGIELTINKPSSNPEEKWIATAQGESTFGSTSLEATSRALVCSLLGHVIEIPKEHHDCFN